MCPKLPQKFHKSATNCPKSATNCPKSATYCTKSATKCPKVAPICPKKATNCPNSSPKMTQLWKIIRLKIISRAGQHHRKHMLDDPPNMIDPINYVLLFSSIPLFKSFHVACMDNYVPLSLMVLFPPHLRYCIFSTRTPPISFLLFIWTGPLKLEILTLSMLWR